ncbi:MAG: hypothetical protein SFV54_20140 [Bryobacteraceae bacterium]|nr:hypothetical protein [Bryobacteraceae bacterium]
MTLFLLAASSMSIGWGIRGQFGHEYGAAMPGALAGIVCALFAGRQEWRERVLFFAFFGALGWSFGGSMSYMKVIAYTHSSGLATVAYGFAGMFLIGFLWAAPGGIGLSLPAVLPRQELTRLFPPLTALFAAWYAQDLITDRWPAPELFDTDWLAAAIALAVGLAFLRRTSLILYAAAGWWLGFASLVLLLGLRLSPPRGDNWAGCVGLVAGLLVWSVRRRLLAVTAAGLVCGALGGLAFSLGQVIRLALMATGAQTNWHSVLEQTQGFLFGLGAAAAALVLARRTPPLPPAPRARRWTETFCLLSVLLLIPYLNLRKSPADWSRYIPTMPEWIYGLPAAGWFLPSRGFLGWLELLYLSLALAVILALRARPALLNTPWEARGQLLYLAFLWQIVFINSIHVIVRFTPQRIVTEWAIALHAVFASALLLCLPPHKIPPATAHPNWPPLLRRAALAALASAAIAVATGTAARYALYGTNPAGDTREQIRFGPRNTDTVR